MGVTTKERRRPAVVSDAEVSALGRLTRRQAIVTCVERDGRLLIAWRSTDGHTLAVLARAFRDVFPAHGDAVYRPPLASARVNIGKGGRWSLPLWSLPLRHRDRLAAWVEARFERGCEIGSMPWD